MERRRSSITGCERGVSYRVRRLRQLCIFISSSFKICSFLDDLPTELRWYAVLNEVNANDGGNDINDDDDDVDDVDAETSNTARTALQSLNHLVSSAKDDVDQRVRGVMTRTVDALSVCIRRKTVAVTSPCSIPTPWHDVSQLTVIVFTHADEGRGSIAFIRVCL